MKFGIMEIGSTNTKGYLYDNGTLTNLGSTYIAFKNNYQKGQQVQEEDMKALMTFIQMMKEKVDTIYAFGTSIFRKMEREEVNAFTKTLQEVWNVSFRVVSSDEENTYTVKGVIDSIDYNGKMAVVIGGGGSTELAIIEGKEILQKKSFDFGAMDITNQFPDLKEDKVKTDFDCILSHTLSLIGPFEDQADILVLAGGDYIYFYEKAGYEMKENTLYDDPNQPYLLDMEIMDQYDHDILEKSLDKIKEENPDNTGWWDGARGMRFCMNAIAKELDAKYIIPTRINMLIGLANEIVNQ